MGERKEEEGMKIVIDIDDNLYTRLFDNGVDNYDDAVDMAKAIRKGKPLPKRHGKLIDSNVLWDAFQDLGQDFYEAFDFAEANAVVEADEEVDDEGRNI